MKEIEAEKAKEKEVNYIAYGENIENTIKLYSSNKAINLVDLEKDMRSKRIFVTSIYDKNACKAVFGGINTEKLCKKLEENPIFTKLVTKKN